MLARKLNASASIAVANLLWTQRRELKTLDVREYRPFALPLEFRAYQRYTTNPVNKAGVIFNTHLDTHRRYTALRDSIDYLWWGKENGQAQLPHRHQRVVFDFNDSVHPTKSLPGTVHGERYFVGQDPTEAGHLDVSATFDPNRRHFSEPFNWNKAYASGRANFGSEARFKYGPSFAMHDSNNMKWSALRASDTLSTVQFGNSLITEQQSLTTKPSESRQLMQNVSNVPGLDRPYLGEKDRHMMQAMSRSADPKSNAVTKVTGRFSSHLFINRPAWNNELGLKALQTLNSTIDCETNGLTRKMTTLTAAQSGLTDYFCGGVALGNVAEQLALCQSTLRDAKKFAEKASTEKDATRKKKLELEADAALHRAAQHRQYVDRTNRAAMELLWTTFSAPRSLQTIVNGRCKNIGNGLALLCKFPGLRDSTELVHDGPNLGITPFGGMTHFLSRVETSLKYPGLAEFVMMTGAPLYSGDVLRLGWSDLFSTIPDVAFHTKQWFDESEHMHNDAVAWQTEHLLNTCWRMKEHHSVALERTAVTAVRAKWIEDAFADQPSVEAIVDTLSQIEKLPLTDASNNADSNASATFTLKSVDVGVDLLDNHNMRFSYSPWDSAEFVDPVTGEKAPSEQAGAFFAEYFLERRGTRVVAKSNMGAMAARWKTMRQEEYESFRAAKRRPHPRHIFVKLEGCEGKLVQFDFEFDQVACARAMGAKPGSEEGDRVMVDVLKRRILAELQMPLTRDVEVGWCLPTFDTAPIHDDEDLFSVLHNDPAIEPPESSSAFPPLYLTVRRSTLHFSEWAYAVKHQMLLASPFALKAAFLLLQQIRGDGSESSVQSVSESLATEFRFLSRLQMRPDFYAIGANSVKSMDEFRQGEERVKRNVHDENPARPIAVFDQVFEKNVEIDGHRFLARPRWFPRTLQEVADNEIMALARPLDFSKDGITEVCVPMLRKHDRIEHIVQDLGGFEVVPGLGEKDSSGKPIAAPAVSNAHVPNNVSFYRMARHPWMDIETSWRIDGFTKGSHEHFLKQYKKAENVIYDPDNKGTRNYWPTKENLDGVNTDDESLLQDRFWNVISSASRNAENWVRELRNKSKEQAFDYVTEIAQPNEKVFDDEYYRWFIKPGMHPNPTGILKDGAVAPRAPTGGDDAAAAAGGAAEEEVVDYIDPIAEAPAPAEKE